MWYVDIVYPFTPSDSREFHWLNAYQYLSVSYNLNSVVLMNLGNYEYTSLFLLPFFYVFSNGWFWWETNCLICWWEPKTQQRCLLHVPCGGSAALSRESVYKKTLYQANGLCIIPHIRENRTMAVRQILQLHRPLRLAT